MSVATTQPAHSSGIRIPVLKPLYGAHFASFSAEADGIYRCGSSAACEFSLEFAGAESTHCSFIRQAGTFSVNRIDGHVWINDLPVRGVNRLNEGDVISLGPVSYRLEFLDAPSYPPEPDDQLSMPCWSAAIVAQPPSDLIVESLPIPVGIAMPCAQDTSVRATLQQELEEHQRLLTLRQQQLAELSQIVRERERDADSRLIAIEERSSQLTAQSNELDRREAEIVAVEERFAETRKTTDAIVQAAESERTALLSANKDQLCERNFLSQLRLDLAGRETGTAEREPLLSAVRELQKALQDARQDVEDAHRIKSASRLQEQRLQQAYQSIEEHCHTLQLSESKLLQSAEQLESLRAELAESVQERERLNAQLDAYSLPANTASPVRQTIAVSGFAECSEALSRELDQRAEQLDRRDEELRERTRKIQQTEGDIESRQRLLQDARQQLELARAEIQVAMRKYTEPAQDVASPLSGPQFGSSVAAQLISDRPFTHLADLESEPDDCESKAPSNFPATDLRSELAGLFGLRKPTAETVTPPPLPSTAYVDESQPSGENQSVIFHFDSDAAQLTATESMRAVSGEEISSREENSDGYVRDYMEQLLSRNRKSAGIALPSELKAAEKKKYPAASTAATATGRPSPKSPPKVKSYIEMYMAGKMGDLENSEALTMSEPAVEVSGAAALNEEPPVQPRQKMDLLKLKEHMESFRALSTLSVENALASHAIKVERHGFSGRAVFAALLIMTTLLLGTANAYGTIDSPVLMWVTLAAAIAIFTELYRRYLAIAVHTRSPLDLLFTPGHAKGPIQQSAKRMASGVVGSPSRDDLSVNEHSVVPSATFGHPESPLAETLVS